MSRHARLGSTLLVIAVLAGAAGLALIKFRALEAAAAAALDQPEPIEAVSATVARPGLYQPTTSVIGTVLATRSVTLRNELPGTVHHVALEPGRIVEPGEILVALDVSVERAELAATEAEAALAESVLARTAALRTDDAVSDEEVDRARADRDIARAQVARIRAIIERKTIRAPFRARVGLSDVHPGQYLNEGTMLTTLQGLDAAVHVDFFVEQRVATSLDVGDAVEVFAADADALPIAARIVAVDARVDPATRNAMVRARIDAAGRAPAPGSSVRVVVPTGLARDAVYVPVNAVRKGPDGDHVFVLETDPAGDLRASRQPVFVTAVVGDDAVIGTGLAAGRRVATTGSFKLRESVRVALAGRSTPNNSAEL